MLSRDCVASPIFIANRVRHTAFWSLKPASWRVQRHFCRPLDCREYLPVTFEFKLMGVQPVFYENTKFSQFSFIRAKYRQVIHIARIMLTQSTFTDKPVKRLQNGIGEPLRCIRSDKHTVFNNAPNQIENTAVFEKLPHTSHHHFGFQAVVKMIDVTTQFVLRTFRVVFHPILDCFSSVMRSSVSDTAATVKVHTCHHLRLQNLNESVVNILVGPLSRLADGTPFLRAGVPTLRNVWFFRFKAFDDDFPQFNNAFLFGFLHPSCAFVRAVVSSPMMSAVYFVYGIS